MKELEKTRVRFEHDILMMQAQADRYTRRKKWLRAAGYSLIAVTGVAVLALVPSLVHDLGPGTPALTVWTPVRAIFSSLFVVFTIGFIATEHYSSTYDRYVKELNYWINNKRNMCEKMS